MSIKELDRFEVMSKVGEKRLSQSEAAALLGISPRQVRRLLKRYRQDGAKGMVSRLRGAPSNHSLPQVLKEEVVGLLKAHYSDFGPTLAAEKLLEVHNKRVSVGTVRNLMIINMLWIPKKAKKKRIFQQRERRSSFGEMLQIDGSPHKWLEDRGPECSLIYTVDDATGKIGSAQFCPSETTWGYMKLLKD